MDLVKKPDPQVMLDTELDPVVAFIVAFMVLLCCALSWQCHQCFQANTRDSLARERLQNLPPEQQLLRGRGDERRADVEFTTGARRLTTIEARS